jgi:hypothetical protein
MFGWAASCRGLEDAILGGEQPGCAAAVGGGRTDRGS